MGRAERRRAGQASIPEAAADLQLVSRHASGLVDVAVPDSVRADLVFR